MKKLDPRTQTVGKELGGVQPRAIANSGSDGEKCAMILRPSDYLRGVLAVQRGAGILSMVKKKPGKSAARMSETECGCSEYLHITELLNAFSHTPQNRAGSAQWVWHAV